jgi:A/G-specific adenine glycosylase
VPEAGGAAPRRAVRTGPPLATARVAALRSRLLAWYEVNGRDLPWRRTTDPYAVLVSEVMLQQTQVPRVVPVYEAFLDAFPGLEALAGAPLADVLLRWRGLGYNNRAERLWRCARTCTARRGPKDAASLPTAFDGLVALPGVGPYTARAVMVFAHNADVAAVDANVRRVLTHELGLPQDLAPRALQAVADAVLPSGRSRDWHNALMDYGSLVLTARATGIAPRMRQSAFEGSRRWYRSRLLRSLLDDGPQTPAALAARLVTDIALVEDLATALERDGLVRLAGGLVTVA